MKRISDFKFNLCISSEYLIDFIEQNTEWDWDTICDMEYEYRHRDCFEYSDAYPIVEIGETDENCFQYWCERFIEEYKDEIGNRTVYILQD